jgi:diacylglycerol kinase
MMPEKSRSPTVLQSSTLRSSFRYALEGLRYVVRSERNARLHLISAIIVILISAWLALPAAEWALIIAAIALVFAGEMLNTVVELAIDLISPEFHPMAKNVKDVAAGAVLVAAIAAAGIGFLILGPRLCQKLGVCIE